jgi:hypothetical protein
MSKSELLLLVAQAVDSLNYLIPKFEDITSSLNSYVEINGCLQSSSGFAVPDNHPDHDTVTLKLKVMDSLRVGLNERISTEFKSAFEKEKLIQALDPNYRSQLSGFLSRMSQATR